MSELLLAYYADDFTGATDALDILSNAGVRTVLFTRPPSPEMLSRFQGLDAIGVAGKTRSLSVEGIEKELTPAIEGLCKLGPAHIHYKVCSTFDSSPNIGSIGRAVEIGKWITKSRYVPMLVGAPSLGRYGVFGNLFAATSIGNSEHIYRLDRHPTASKHPSTPMHESDLRLHLADQTNARIELFDLLMLDLPAAERKKALGQLIEAGADVVLFDVLNKLQLITIGELLDHRDFASTVQFSVGSSGIEMALAAHWQKAGKINAKYTCDIPEQCDNVLVVSGSCSPVSESQINWAIKQGGFVEVVLDTPTILANEGAVKLIEQIAKEVSELLSEGKSVILHTSKGLKDSRIAKVAKLTSGWKITDGECKIKVSQILGESLGHILSLCLERTTVKRVCVAGGDTSSHVAQAVGVESLESLCPLVPGAPLCLAKGSDSPIDGKEVVFKGGQVGNETFFGSLLLDVI